MKQFFLSSVLMIVLATVCVSPAWSQNETNRQTISFSDPSRPGTLAVRLMNGSVTIKGYDGKTVLVESTGPRMFEVQSRSNTNPADIKDLRRIDSNSGNLGIDEANNTISIQSRWGNMADLQVQVPFRTNITVSANSGNTVIEGVEGEIEVNGMHGDIALNDVSGSVVAHSGDGKITGTIRRLTPQKPMSLVTSNGVIDITLPPDAKANVRARTLDGEIYTGFLATELVLQPFGRSENAAFDTIIPAGGRADVNRSGNLTVIRPARTGVFIGPGPFHPDIDRSAAGTLNGGGPDFDFRTLHGNIYIRKKK